MFLHEFPLLVWVRENPELFVAIAVPLTLWRWEVSTNPAGRTELILLPTGLAWNLNQWNTCYWPILTAVQLIDDPLKLLSFWCACLFLRLYWQNICDFIFKRSKYKKIYIYYFVSWKGIKTYTIMHMGIKSIFINIPSLWFLNLMHVLFNHKIKLKNLMYILTYKQQQ